MSTPAPERAPLNAGAARRRMMVRRRRTVAVLLVVLLAASTYVAACAFTPLPAPEITLSAEAEREVVADTAGAEAAVQAQLLPTAIGWADGDEVWSNDDTAYPMGSVTKLITALVCLEAQPLDPGADGETYVWTDEDRERQDYYLGLEGVAYPIPVGTEITQREMLQLMFLPSANDFAYAYAMMTFGSNEAFLEALDAFTAEHGLDSITLAEPTGMDDLNRANAADLVRVARLALQNPTIREFTAMQSAIMPWGIGTIENTNPLLGKVPGIVGLKTGMLSTVGYNLVVAQERDAFGRSTTKIAVTLARPSEDERAASGAQMLDAMEPLPQQLPLVDDGAAIGSIRTAWGEEVPLVTSGDASAVLLPGEHARLSTSVKAPGEGEAGARAGEVSVSSPTGEVTVPVVTTADLTAPDLWWRITHPALVFGW